MDKQSSQAGKKFENLQDRNTSLGISFSHFLSPRW